MEVVFTKNKHIPSSVNTKRINTIKDLPIFMRGYHQRNATENLSALFMINSLPNIVFTN